MNILGGYFFYIKIRLNMTKIKEKIEELNNLYTREEIIEIETKLKQTKLF